MKERDGLKSMLNKYKRHLSEIQANVRVLTAERDKTRMHYQQVQHTQIYQVPACTGLVLLKTWSHNLPLKNLEIFWDACLACCSGWLPGWWNEIKELWSARILTRIKLLLKMNEWIFSQIKVKTEMSRYLFSLLLPAVYRLRKRSQNSDVMCWNQWNPRDRNTARRLRVSWNAWKRREMTRCPIFTTWAQRETAWERDSR